MKSFVIILTFSILFIAPLTFAQINFSPPTNFPTVGDYPYSVFASDLDGDGDKDLVTANWDLMTSYDISVFINFGNGNFQFPECYELGGLTQPTSVFASDLDSDGDNDLAIANEFSNNVSILPNNGDGTFQVIGRNYSVGTGPISIFVSDLDGDWDKDIATANRGILEPDDISVLMNNVDGTFQEAVHYGVGGISEPYYIFASDLDGDVDKDLVVANNRTDNLSILPNNGDGTFQVTGLNYEIDGTPQNIFASDLDNDGDKDLVTAIYISSLNGNGICILKNNGDGTFQTPVYYLGFTTDNATGVLASDLDGDGDKDVVMANGSQLGNPSNMTIFINTGNGAFQLLGAEFPLSDFASSIFASDLDGDGDNDLAMTNYNIDGSVNQLSVYFNQFDPEFGAISGTITNTNGAKLRDAWVKIFMIDDFGEYSEFAIDTTNADGEYFVDDLFPGRYSLEVYRNGYYKQTKYGIVPEGGVGTTNFTLELAGFIHDSDYVAGDNPYCISASDFDSDGDLDIAVANVNSNNVSILFNVGNGTYEEAVNYGVGDQPCSISAADLDGDGDEDLAVTNYFSYNVSVLINNGNGIYQIPINYTVGSRPRSLVATDLDLDGDIDLGIANEYSNNITILINDGVGNYQAAGNFAVGTSPTSVSASDLDGDGDKDLAVTNGFNDNVSILKNNGNGTFQSAINYGVGNVPYSIFASDFDNDVDIDLAVANASSNNISILKNNGDGTFLPKVDFPAGEVPFSVFASDFDGDGFEDLAVATTGNFDTDSVSILLNNGNATFQMPVRYIVGQGNCSVFAADFDEDGDMDLAAANGSSDNISILLNQSIITGLENSTEFLLPESFSISQNYPNPFNPSTTFRYSIPKTSKVVIKVYDILGNEIALLMDEEKPIGTYELTWNAESLPSGVYFYKIQAGNFVETKKMILMK